MAGVIVLASRSPQRRSLLRSLGVDHRVIASQYPEDAPDDLTDPGEIVAHHARMKARDVADRGGIPAGGAVLGSDTAVVLDGTMLGKPRDRDDAAGMLDTLGGRTHRVASAIHLIPCAGDERAHVAWTDVTFRPIPPSLREWYLDRGEWQGRAGAYAIQGSGSALVEGVNGDFTTVVGLPVAALARMLEDAGLAPWVAPAPGWPGPSAAGRPDSGPAPAT